MDTRKKITPLSQAEALLKTGDWTVIAGLFDPLTAVQAKRIEDQKHGQVMVIVLEGEETLLPVDARCCLMASLRSVDFVVPAVNHRWRSILPHNNAHIHVIDDPQAEKRRSEEFVQRILTRQGDAVL